MTKRIKINIDDMTFYVVGDDDERYVRELAQNLDERVKFFQKNNYRLSQNAAYILSALNSLDEYEKLKREQKEISEYSGNEKALKEKIDEIKVLDQRCKNFEKDKESLESERSIALEKLEKKEEELRNVKAQVLTKEQKLKDLEKEIENLQKKNSSLKDQNVSAQKKIIELSRELESLYENRERQK